MLIKNKTKKPGIPPIPLPKEKEIIRIACREKLVDATHWCSRNLAKRLGMSRNKVSEILRDHGLKPYLHKTFNLSKDPDFEDKLNDYFRHGTTTLFAALNEATGRVIGSCQDSHRKEEFISFLKTLDRRISKKKRLHLILDNYSTHKKKEVQRHLQSKGGRFVFHFTLTHSSWLNLVERWFAEITEKRIRTAKLEKQRRIGESYFELYSYIKQKQTKIRLEKVG